MSSDYVFGDAGARGVEIGLCFGYLSTRRLDDGLCFGRLRSRRLSTRFSKSVVCTLSLIPSRLLGFTGFTRFLVGLALRARGLPLSRLRAPGFMLSIGACAFSQR